MMQTGEATSRSAALRAGRSAEEQVQGGRDRGTVHHPALHVDEHQAKPFDNPKVREAINYAINKEALAKVAFAGYATPMEGVVPQGVDYAFKTGPWPMT
jgi:ABC-type transport system substrate-binding protein